MSELRERVAKEMHVSDQIQGGIDPAGAKEFVDRHWRLYSEALVCTGYLARADAAMAVIVQDRAERLEARMPEIEAAIAAYGKAKYRQGNDPGLDTWNAAGSHETVLLALIREVAG